MAGEGSPTQLPQAKRRNKSSSATTTTTIHSLTDDLLLQIFLRLPSLATLVRAALACRRHRRAVVSSPDFRRRFRELHPAPLMGLFFAPPTAVLDPMLPAFPSFFPARRHDRDLAAALRGGDFFLTSIQEHPDKAHSWEIYDCRGGYVLLCNGDQSTERPMAVVNPLARRSQRFFDDGLDDTFEDCRGTPVLRSERLLCSDEDPTTFRVVALTHDESRVRASVFFSDTGEWKIHPWFDVPGRPRRSKGWLLNNNMQSKGFMYWLYTNHNFDIGETNSGARCIVYTVDFTVGVMLRRTDSDGVEKWMLDRATPLDTQLDGVLRNQKGNYDELLVVAVRDGFAYLASSKKVFDPQTPSWFLSLCLETMKLENLFQKAYNSGGHPYVMAWPPCLVGNHGRFALEGST
ncbi:unnamed protein product [Urochloa decumbens]|uniref:F-box domain-containing protein n=1 Tax=Urochloa decumbens TaxID=240449 RepID=A0ABC9A9B7_9POAL